MTTFFIGVILGGLGVAVLLAVLMSNHKPTLLELNRREAEFCFCALNHYQMTLRNAIASGTLDKIAVLDTENAVREITALGERIRADLPAPTLKSEE